MGVGTFPGDPSVRIARMARTGGAALQPVATLAGEWPASAMGLDAESVYFITHEGLYRADKTGGPAQPLLLDNSLWSAGASLHIAVDAAWVYVHSNVDGFLRVPRSGGPAENVLGLYPGLDFPRGVTVIGPSMYWSTCRRTVVARTGDAAPTLLGAGPQTGPAASLAPSRPTATSST